MVEVVVVDVGDERYGRVVEEEGTVRFVGLDDKGLTRADGRARAKRRDNPAVHEARSSVEGVEGRHNHAGRRGLAVGASDRDESAAPREPDQGLRAVQDVEPALLREDKLGIVRPEGARDHDRVGVTEVFRCVTDLDARAAIAQLPRRVVLGAVAPGDREAAVEHHARDAAHA